MTNPELVKNIRKLSARAVELCDASEEFATTSHALSIQLTKLLREASCNATSLEQRLSGVPEPRIGD